MYTCRSPGAIGIKMALPEAITLAADTGFEGLEFGISEAAGLAEQHGAEYVKDLFAAGGVRVGNWGCPMEFRRDDAAYRADLGGLTWRPSCASWKASATTARRWPAACSRRPALQGPV